MRAPKPLACLLAWATLLGAPIRADELAYLRSGAQPKGAQPGAQGNAWLFNRGGQCFALTPKHILINPVQGRDDRYAALVIVRPGRPPQPAEGDRCAVFKTRDLAVLRVSGVADLADCGRVLAGVASLDPLLERTAQASLVVATESGRFERSTLQIRAATAFDTEHFWVAANSDRDRLAEGMSGGLISIQDQLAGFLLAVDTSPSGPTAGMARVLRANRAATLASRVIDGASTTDEVDGSCGLRVPSSDRPAARGASALRLGLADPGCGAQVVGWSSPPTDEHSRAENLLGAGGSAARWISPVPGEVHVDIKTCAAKGSGISRVHLDTQDCPAQANEGLDVEVLMRMDASGAFATLGYGGLPRAGQADITTGSPLLGRDLRIRIVARRGAPTVCLGPLTIE